MPAVNGSFGLDLPVFDVAHERSKNEQAAQRGVKAEAHVQLLDRTDGRTILGMSVPHLQPGVTDSSSSWDPLRIYGAALGLGALVTTVALAARGGGFNQVSTAWPLILLAFLALLVERESIAVTPTTDLSVAFLPLVFVEVVFGPLAAVGVAAVAMLADFPWAHVFGRPHDPIERPYLRWAVWTSNRVLVAACGGLAAQAVLVDDSPTFIVLATVAAMVTTFAADAVLMWITIRVRGRESASDAMIAVAKVAAAGIPIYGAVAALLAYAYIAITPMTAALFFIPALAAHRLFVVTRRQQDALASLAAANERLEKANLSFATALVATLDARDRYTAGHSEAVAMYAKDIAMEFGWSETDQQLVDLCGLVHDIGKIGLPAGLLEKPGALTPEERLQMEDHSAIGERILANVEDYSDIAVIVRHHHERWDGSGYPDGLAGTEIPLISRVLAVADAYDAMTSDRPYRAALPSAEARRRLREGASIQFDADVVAAFEAVLDRANPRYLAGRAIGQPRDTANSESVVALAS
jgi:putative nucleotidyltransferase with HDIG domain